MKVKSKKKVKNKVSFCVSSVNKLTHTQYYEHVEIEDTHKIAHLRIQQLIRITDNDAH